MSTLTASPGRALPDDHLLVHVRGIALPARPQDVGTARRFASDYCKPHGVSDAVRHDVSVYMSELMTNAVIHARFPVVGCPLWELKDGTCEDCRPESWRVFDPSACRTGGSYQGASYEYARRRLKALAEYYRSVADELDLAHAAGFRLYDVADSGVIHAAKGRVRT